METQAVSLKILGRTYKFNCPVDQVEALKISADNLDTDTETLRKRSPQISSEQAIVTVALNLSNELAQEKQKNLNLVRRLADLQGEFSHESKKNEIMTGKLENLQSELAQEKLRNDDLNRLFENLQNELSQEKQKNTDFINRINNLHNMVDHI